MSHQPSINLNQARAIKLSSNLVGYRLPALLCRKKAGSSGGYAVSPAGAAMAAAAMNLLKPEVLYLRFTLAAPLSGIMLDIPQPLILIACFESVSRQLAPLRMDASTVCWMIQRLMTVAKRVDGGRQKRAFAFQDLPERYGSNSFYLFYSALCSKARNVGDRLIMTSHWSRASETRRSLQLQGFASAEAIACLWQVRHITGRMHSLRRDTEDLDIPYRRKNGVLFRVQAPNI